jgi:predicted transcriptional regulator
MRLPAKIYHCSFCKKKIKRYQSTVRNPDKVYCSVLCKGKHQELLNIGINNPNYRHGDLSYCHCGNKKDYRSKECAFCSKRGFPMDKMPRYKISKIKLVIKKSDSFLKAALLLGISRGSLSNYVKKNKISITHFRPARNRFTKFKNLFKKGTIKRNGILTSTILRNKLLKYKCSECGQIPIWNKKPLKLQLHHIDGNPTNNVLKNLTFLCPNCHTQTKTYTGKKARNKF